MNSKIIWFAVDIKGWRKAGRIFIKSNKQESRGVSVNSLLFVVRFVNAVVYNGRTMNHGTLGDKP